MMLIQFPIQALDCGNVIYCCLSYSHFISWQNVSGEATVSRRLHRVVGGHVSFGVGIGVVFCRSVFARFLANCIPSLAEFLVAKRHSDLFFDPDTDTDPDFIRFLCLSLSANIK